MALFSKQNKEVFTNPLNLDHPILGQVLGICSALAVTSQLKPAIVMGLAVTVITAFANVIISIIRNTIPNRIRIVVQLVVVAALVTIVSQILKAFAYDVSVQLSVYVGLIKIQHNLTILAARKGHIVAFLGIHGKSQRLSSA